VLTIEEGEIEQSEIVENL
jgi:hypothetical protein